MFFWKPSYWKWWIRLMRNPNIKKSLESGLTPILVIWLLMISFTYSKVFPSNHIKRTSMDSNFRVSRHWYIKWVLDCTSWFKIIIMIVATETPTFVPFLPRHHCHGIRYHTIRTSILYHGVVVGGPCWFYPFLVTIFGMHSIPTLVKFEKLT